MRYLAEKKYFLPGIKISMLISLLGMEFLGGCGRPEIEVIRPPKQTSTAPVKKSKSTRLVKKPLFSKESFKANPFLTPEEAEYFEKNKRERIYYLKLSAVFHGEDNARAIINGRLIKEKDIIDNKRVVKINPEEVILRDYRGKEYIIRTEKIVDEKE